MSSSPSPHAADSSFTLDSRWSSIDELMSAHAELRLDLGCGNVKPPGYVGLDSLVGVPLDQARPTVPDDAPNADKDAANGPDVYLDLNREAFPFPDGSCVEVRARHFLEHSVLDHIFAETWRVLEPGGLFAIVVPYANSAWGMYPGHSIFLTERFFQDSHGFQTRFEITDITYRQDEAWEAWPRLLRRLIPYGWARQHLFNVCKEMRIEARARK